MKPSIEAALAAIRGRRAVVVGDIVLDAYLYGETVRVSREAPVIVVRKERVEHRLGGAANTAANLAALGVETELLGAISDDANGERVRGMLTAAGVDVSRLGTSPRATAVKTRILAGAFGTSRQQVLRIDEEPDVSLSDAAREAIARDVATRGERAQVVVVSEYGYSLASAQLADTAKDLARRGVPVCVDSRHSLADFAGVTAVTPNVPEAEELAGHAITNDEAVRKAGGRIVERLAVGACLLTQGRGGMTLFRAGAEPAHVDIVGEDEVADVTGAGDTVIATFSAALAARLGMHNGMVLANVAAGIVVMKTGTATASPEEIAHTAARHGVTLEPWDA